MGTKQKTRTDKARLWSDLGVETVAPGVHRLPLPLAGDALRAVNVYAVEDSRGVVLIDAGVSSLESWRALEAGLRAVGSKISDVHSVLVTHIHYDHFGQAAAIARASGALVRLDRREGVSFRSLMRPMASRRRQRLLGMERAGAQPLIAEADREAPSERFTDYVEPEWLDGESYVQLGGRPVEALRTPGHTWGHLCFFDRDRGLLFAGDHVLPHITPSIGVETPQLRLILGHYLRSLASVRELPVATVLPAHGAVFSDLRRRVDELSRHHALRLDAAEAAVVAGASTGFDVARRLLWTRRDTRFDELDLFNRMLAVRETVAHLDLLVAQGKLLVTEGHHIAHYQSAVRSAQ